MKYLDFTSNYISVRIRHGHWMPRAQAAFLSKAVCALMGSPETRTLLAAGVSDGALYIPKDSTPNGGILRMSLQKCIQEYFGGSAPADALLRLYLTPAEYRIIDGIANFTSGETAAKRQSIFVASDLNTGRNLVLVARV